MEHNYDYTNINNRRQLDGNNNLHHDNNRPIRYDRGCTEHQGRNSIVPVDEEDDSTTTTMTTTTTTPLRQLPAIDRCQSTGSRRSNFSPPIDFGPPAFKKSRDVDDIHQLQEKNYQLQKQQQEAPLHYCERDQWNIIVPTDCEQDKHPNSSLSTHCISSTSDTAVLAIGTGIGTEASTDGEPSFATLMNTSYQQWHEISADTKHENTMTSESSLTRVECIDVAVSSTVSSSATTSDTKSDFASKTATKAVASSATTTEKSIVQEQGEYASTNTKSNDDPTSKDYYFDSYAHHAIHEEMLKDEVRTKTYEMAIMQNKHLFQDKIILDVGCGTGILSMFAAQAGAKHVYAIDCSSIIEQAQQIIDRNGFSNKITLIRGKVEETELPVKTVDIIVSEWMGYFLLYESMLDTVLYARDKWLIPNTGIVFPDKAVLYLTAIEDATVRRERFDFWDDVYGFDMSPIKEIAIKEPVVDIVDSKALVTDAVPILRIDILTCTKEDLTFTSKFVLQARRNDYIHGLVAYFECAFTQIHKPIGFSTSPYARYTHWKQTILYLQDTITICAGEIITGELSCKPNKRNSRDLDIGLSLSFQGRYSQFDPVYCKYRLR